MLSGKWHDWRPARAENRVAVTVLSGCFPGLWGAKASLALVPLGVGFQRRGPRPPAFVSLGVQGEVETPWCFSSGVWGRVLFQKRMRPTSLRWEPSLAGAGNHVKARGIAARFSVSKKSFRPAWGRNTPSAQPVSVCFAPENRGLSSKQARFIRRWRRFACFPFLGFPRTPFTRKGYAASAARQSRWRLPYLTVAESLLLY